MQHEAAHKRAHVALAVWHGGRGPAHRSRLQEGASLPLSRPGQLSWAPQGWIGCSYEDLPGKQGKVCPRTGTRRNRGGKPLRAKLESLRGSPDPSSPPLGGRGTADRLPPHLLSSQLSWVAASEPPCSPLAERTRALAQRPLSSRTLCGPPYTPGSMAHRPCPARCADGGTEAQEEARDTAQY